ncbi:MAG: hypothetical protein QXM12_04230 [Nitrososphaerota archaeon]
MSKPLAKPQPVKPQQPSHPSQPRPQPQKKSRVDFDSELLGRHVSIKLLDGTIVNGIVTDCSRFWLRVLSGEKILFVHKAAIVLVEALSVKK